MRLKTLIKKCIYFCIKILLNDAQEFSHSRVTCKSQNDSKIFRGDFEVQSSFGHVVDLPKKSMGIDIENHFKPEYEISPDKRDVVKKLKELSSKAETVWLASDEDREGEAIAWHLYNELGLRKKIPKELFSTKLLKKQF